MTPPELPRCPSCQAPHKPDEAFCWMCRRRIWADPEPAPRVKPAPAAPHAAAAPAPAAPVETWTHTTLVVAFILILTGLAMGPVAGGALLWLGLIPALFVTTLSGLRSPKKKPETPLEKFSRVVSLIVSAVGVVIIAIVAIIIALFAVCTVIVAGMAAVRPFR